MSRSIYTLLSVYLIVSSSAWGVISLTSPTDEWTSVQLGMRNDYLDDEQAQKPGGDIVGSELFGQQDGFYRKYDYGTVAGISDDELAFRVRLGDDTTAHAFIGLDIAIAGVNGGLPDGTIDMFLDASFGNTNGSKNVISFYDAGGNLNNSPSTTSVSDEINFVNENDDLDFSTYSDLALVSSSNDSYVAANPTIPSLLDIDGDASNDVFLTFKVPMSALNTAYLTYFPSNVPLTETTLMSFVLLTATQANSFNQDFGGLPKTFVDDTWTALGAITDPEAVPEPATYALLFGVCALGFAAVRRRR